MNQQLAFGIDIGGTTSKWALVDRDGHVLYSSSCSTTEPKNVEEFVAGLAAQMKQAYEKYGKGAELKGIGIGSPNGNYLTGNIELPPNLPWGDNVPITALFQKEFNLPVKLTNDANAAACGELFYGKYSPPLKNFILITLGTGLGSGIVVDGKLLHGAHGMAGELGHITAYDDGRLCGCGLKGCLEAYVSAIGIHRTFFELLEESSEPSKLRGINAKECDMVMIYNAAISGDAIALEAFRKSGELLGRRLANSVAHLQPEVILLCGGLMKGQALFLPAAQEAFEKSLFPVYRGKVTIQATKSGGENLAVLGAAALIWESDCLSGFV